MGREIERKFIAKHDGWREAEPVLYRQGYLSRSRDRTVRVRIAGDRAYLTVKGLTHGMSRPEFEYEIPPDDAAEMLAFCDGPVIEKLRRKIEYDGLVWEVDEFLGANQGLILAEVELEREDQPVTLPPWVEREVTGDPRYYNASLVNSPFSRWPQQT